MKNSSYDNVVVHVSPKMFTARCHWIATRDGARALRIPSLCVASSIEYGSDLLSTASVVLKRPELSPVEDHLIFVSESNFQFSIL